MDKAKNPHNVQVTKLYDKKHAVIMHLLLKAGESLKPHITPTVASFLTYLKGLAPKNRVGLAFGSYGWGGQSVGIIYEILKNCGFEMLDKIRIQYIPDSKILKEIREKLVKDLHK